MHQILTFNIPNFNNKFAEGTTDTNNLGNLIQAGLPNIIGDITAVNAVAWQLPHGAIYTSGSGYNAVASSGTGSYSNILNFNASRSSSIYGNSSTVQPQSIKTFVLIKH